MALVILLQVLSFQAQATTWYVSNAANNSYASGSDSNDGTTTSTPFLTIAQANSAASAGDLINVNPSGTAYEEATGSFGYLSVDKPITIQTDPSLLGVAKVVIRPGIGADRPLQCAANGIVLQDLVIDANNTSTLSQGVMLQSGFVTITLRRCDFVNFPLATSFCLSTSITNGDIMLDRCTATSANGVDPGVTFLEASGTRPNVSVTILGCTVSGIQGVFLQSGLTSQPFILACDSAPDGTRNTFSNLSYCITWGVCPPGTAITVNNADLYNIDADPFRGSGSPAPSLPSLTLGGMMVTNTGHSLVSNQSGESIGSLRITGLSYTGANYVVNNAGTISKTRIENATFAGNGPVIYSATPNMQDVGFAHCQFSSNTTAINLPEGGHGLSVESCQFSDCTSTAIVLSGVFPNILIRSNTLVGSYGLLEVDGVNVSNIIVDGNSISLVNAAADPIAVIGSTGVEISNNRILSDADGYHGIMVGTDGYGRFDLNSGQSTTNNLGDTSLDAWIAQPWTMVASSTYSSRIMASFSVSARMVGSPTGTIAAFLYSDSSGSPGSLLATSSISVNASLLSSSATRLLEFWFDTPYTVSYSTTYWVVLEYTGTVNGADYVVLDSNTTGSPLSTSANGTSWSSSSNALIYNIYHGNFECVNPLIHDNYIACSTPSNSMEAVFLGAVTGGQVYRNQVYGGGGMVDAKLVDGSSTPCLYYDNLVFEYSGTQQGLRDKGSRGVQFLHNTVVLNGTRGVAVTLDNNFITGTSYNGHPSVNAVVRNNIIYAYSLPGSGVLYQLGERGYISPTCVSPTIDYNLVFCGSGLAYFGVDASDGATGTGYASWSGWQEAGYDTHGINADPLLSNPSNPTSPAGFTPAQASPVIGAGTNELAPVPTDFYGLTNSATPTLGAIQPPTVLPDTNKPTFYAGEFDQNGLPFVSVTFSKPMNLASISTMSNYSISGASIVGIIVDTNSGYGLRVQLQLAGEPASLPAALTIVGITDYAGNAPASSSVSVTSAGLFNADIGDATIPDPAWPGYMWNDGAGAFTVLCEGSDIWNSMDAFNFSYESKTNDFDVVVRQMTFTKSDNNSKGGLMVREDLTPYSRNWNIVNNPTAVDGVPALDGSGNGANTIECNCRSTNGLNGAVSLSWATGPAAAPNYPNAWLRLKRNGQILRAYWSTNAVPSSSWTQAAMTDLSTNANGPLPAAIYVGIACTAHVNDPVAATVLKYQYRASFTNYNSTYIAPTNTPQAKLSAATSGANILISWSPSGGTLQSSPNAGTDGTWTPIGTANPATVPLSGNTKFFRIAP